MLSLTSSKFFGSLEHFDIGQNEIGDVGCQIISACVMRNLKFMNLKHNGIGEAGYKFLADSPNMPKL